MTTTTATASADTPADELTRTPPHDLPAERAVLGSMALSRDALADILEIIPAHRAEDFYRPAHQITFEAAVSLFARGEPVDAITLARELETRGQLDQAGGAAYLHTLIASVPTVASAGYYAQIVADKAVLRRLATAGMRITSVGFGGGDVALAADTASAALHAALDVRTDGEPQLPTETLNATLEELSRLADHSGGVTGLPTGFHDLDKCLGGLHPGQLGVVAGRPGMGKSTLGLDMARHCAVKNGLPALLFSLEMTRDEINMRMLSAQAGVSLHAMRTGKMSPADWTRLTSKTPDILGAPLYVDDSADLTLMSIRAKTRRVAQRAQAAGGLRLVIVDYLQLLSTGMGNGRRHENRQVEVAEMSRSLKQLAKELGVPVIALAQLNRASEQRADKKPQLSDLRESGAVEQDADIVILLYREDAYEEKSARAGEADIIVAKHRNGPTGVVTVAFQGSYSRFVDMAT